ncbi:MAG: hypothetical protein K2L94_01955 [Alphaproteobacteria bacterium]|nr:hypothetical protein [Alphaproteobacteria bacterium]
MKTFEKIVNVMAQNIFYTVILAVAIVLFAIFSDGLLAGLITAASALIAYICVELLYKEYARVSAPRAATKPASVKKPASKKTAPKKSVKKK